MSKEVYKKIAEISNRDSVELKAEKIELADFADPKTQVERVEKLNQEVNGYSDEINRVNQKVKKPRKKPEI